MGLFHTLRNFIGEKQIVLLAFWANFKGKIKIRGVCENEAVRGLTNLQSDAAKEMYKAYTANGMTIDAHCLHETWPVVIKALI